MACQLPHEEDGLKEAFKDVLKTLALLAIVVLIATAVTYFASKLRP